MDHGVLLHKLRAFGIHGKIGIWLAAFLRDRYQSVVVEGRKSSYSAVTSGVPQGTVLGPVLFLVLISDIDKGTSADTRVRSFADDTRASRPIKTSDDSKQLQADLRIIYSWAERVNMQFNGDKFEVMRAWPETKNWTNILPFSFRNEFTYEDSNGGHIQEKDHIKDLGIMLSCDLTFTEHISKTVKSCTKLAGWIFRTFRTRSPSIMLTVWKSMVQSRFDYCSQLWSPSNAAEIQQLEDVQRSFTSRIAGMDELNYRERLARLRIYSQERRRERYATIFLWKVAMGLVEGYSLTFTNYGRRGRLCSVKDTPRTAPCQVRRARESSLAVKGAKIFNLLPAQIMNITSDKGSVFKTALDKYLARIPDEPTIVEEGRAAETNSLLHQIPISLWK